MSEPHICPNCGSSNWLTKNHDRLVVNLDWKTRDCARLARENGLLQYKLYEALEDVKRQTSALMQKNDRQRRQLNTMEKKLRKRGEQPYGEGTT